VTIRTPELDAKPATAEDGNQNCAAIGNPEGTPIGQLPARSSEPVLVSAGGPSARASYPHSSRPEFRGEHLAATQR
jgi:hypothetical protein